MLGVFNRKHVRILKKEYVVYHGSRDRTNEVPATVKSQILPASLDRHALIDHFFNDVMSKKEQFRIGRIHKSNYTASK